MTRLRPSSPAFPLFLLAGLLLALAGCPKAVPPTVVGTDDEQMDQYAAKLEELKTRTGLSCTDYCSMKGNVCALSTSVCAISGRLADRADFQARCITAQEECARYNEGCSNCPK